MTKTTIKTEYVPVISGFDMEAQKNMVANMQNLLIARLVALVLGLAIFVWTLYGMTTLTNLSTISAWEYFFVVAGWMGCLGVAVVFILSGLRYDGVTGGSDDS